MSDGFMGYMVHHATERFFPDMMHGWNCYANDNNKEDGMSANFTDAEKEELRELAEKVEQFTSDVFDWVRVLGREKFLGHLYDLRARIDELMKEDANV